MTVSSPNNLFCRCKWRSNRQKSYQKQTLEGEIKPQDVPGQIKYGEYVRILSRSSC